MLEDALTLLFSLIQEGIEFPDAVWMVTQEYLVTCSELEAAYDAI